MFNVHHERKTSRLWCGSHLGLNNTGIDLNVKDSCVQVHHERKTSRLWRGSHLGLNTAGCTGPERRQGFIAVQQRFTTNERPHDCGVALWHLGLNKTGT